jgi:nuclear pore complex protein Nup133
MLSIGKLAHLAQLHEGETSADEYVLDGLFTGLFPQYYLTECDSTAFHDDLDFVSVNQSLTEHFQSVLSSVRVRQSLEGKVESIVRAEATLLTDQKAHLKVGIINVLT